MVGSHIAAFSYVGFANLMLRRYPEALRSLNTVLIYLARSKTYHQRLPQVFSFVFDALISGFGTALASLWPPFGLPLASLWPPFGLPLASLWPAFLRLGRGPEAGDSPREEGAIATFHGGPPRCSLRLRSMT